MSQITREGLRPNKPLFEIYSTVEPPTSVRSSAFNIILFIDGQVLPTVRDHINMSGFQAITNVKP